MSKQDFYKLCTKSIFVSNDDWVEVLERIPSAFFEGLEESIKHFDINEIGLVSPHFYVINPSGYICGTRFSPRYGAMELVQYINGANGEFRSLDFEENAYLSLLNAYKTLEENQTFLCSDYKNIGDLDVQLLYKCKLAAIAMIEMTTRLINVYSDEALVSSEMVGDTIGILCKKSADYSQAFRRHGMECVITRLWEKIVRFTNMASKNNEGHYEPFVDSARDLLGYSLIALGLIEEIRPRIQDFYKI